MWYTNVVHQFGTPMWYTNVRTYISSFVGVALFTPPNHRQGGLVGTLRTLSQTFATTVRFHCQQISEGLKTIVVVWRS